MDACFINVILSRIQERVGGKHPCVLFVCAHVFSVINLTFDFVNPELHTTLLFSEPRITYFALELHTILLFSEPRITYFAYQVPCRKTVLDRVELIIEILKETRLVSM